MMINKLIIWSSNQATTDYYKNHTLVIPEKDKKVIFYITYGNITRSKIQSCSVLRHVLVSRHYFSKSRSRFEGLKSWSRLDTFKSRKIDISSPYFYFFYMGSRLEKNNIVCAQVFSAHMSTNLSNITYRKFPVYNYDKWTA